MSADWVRDHLAEATGRSLRIVDVTLGAEDKYKKYVALFHSDRTKSEG